MIRPAIGFPAGTPRGAHACLGALADGGADGAAALSALDALLAECLRSGASRLHVEIDAHGTRVRVRRDGRLDSRRLELGDTTSALAALDAALAACCPAKACDSPAMRADERRTFVGRVGHARTPVRVAFRRLDGAARTSVVFELAAWASHAPTLDELVDDAGAIERLRDALGAPDGLILLVGLDSTALATLADAIAQESTAPDRKIVQASAAIHHPLAGVVQLECGAAAPACAAALLGQDADVLVIDDGPSPAALAAVTERAAGRALVVRALTCDGTLGALTALAAEGTGPNWLANRLRAVVRLDRLRTLCTHCRGPLSEDALAAAGGTSPALLTPLSRALVGTLQRFCDAPGCERCEGTGVERAAHAIDVLRVDEHVASLLRDGAVADAANVLDASRTLPARARGLARRGKVAVEEAERLQNG